MVLCERQGEEAGQGARRDLLSYCAAEVGYSPISNVVNLKLQSYMDPGYHVEVFQRSRPMFLVEQNASNEPAFASYFAFTLSILPFL